MLFSACVPQTCSVFVDVCFVLFLFYLIACNEFAFKSIIHRGSAFKPGASGLPYYCTPPVCVPAVIATGRASCVVTNNPLRLNGRMFSFSLGTIFFNQGSCDAKGGLYSKI